MLSWDLDEKQPCERPNGFEVRALPGTPVFCPAAEGHRRCSAAVGQIKKEGRAKARPCTCCNAYRTALDNALLVDFPVGRQSIQPVLGRCRFLPVAVVLDEVTQNLCGLFVVPCSRE